MKRRALVFGLTLASIVALATNGYATESEWIPKGNVAIAPKFVFADTFNESGLAYAISSRGTEGYINLSGKFVLRRPNNQCEPLNQYKSNLASWNSRSTPESESIFSFSPDLNIALASISDKKKHKCVFGYINLRGKYVVSPKYFEAGPFDSKSGLAVVGKLKNPKKFCDRYSYECSVRFGYINTKGRVVIKLKFQSANPFDESTGLALVQDAKSGLFGYIDKTGKYVIRPQFDNAGDFNASNLAVIGYDTGKKGPDGSTFKYGYINTSGKIVIKPKFYDVSYAYEIDAFNFDPLTGLALVTVPTGEKDTIGRDLYKQGYIDSAGDFVIEPIYDCAQEFSYTTGFALVGIDNGEDSIGQQTCIYTYISKDGVPISEPIFTSDEHFSSFGLTPASTGDEGNEGYIDSTGKFVIEPTFTCARPFAVATGLALASIGKNCSKIGFIDVDGAFVVNPQFSDAKPYDPSTRLAAVKIGKYWGYIN